MREMKDSGIDLLGQIPISWNRVRLRFLCDITTGNQDTQDANSDGEYPFYVRSPIVEYSDRYTFDGESILMAGDGAGAGKVFHYIDDGKHAVHQRVYRLYDFRGIKGKYLHYFMETLFSFEIDKGSAQTTVPSVRLPMIQNFNICFPSIIEQERIIEFLDSRCKEIDELITDVQSQINILEQYKQSVITEVVTKGLNTNVEMKDSGIEWGEAIPVHWNVHPVYYYFTERKKRNIRGKENNLLSLSFGRVIRKDINSNGGLLPENFNTYNIVEDGDIIIRPTDLQNDKRSLRTGLVKEHGIITSAYIDLMPICYIDTRYFHYLLHSYDVMKVFYNMGNGVRQGLNFSEFSRLMIFEPSYQEQVQIADFLDEKIEKIDALIDTKKQQLIVMETYKKSIIYEYVTGKREVK